MYGSEFGIVFPDSINGFQLMIMYVGNVQFDDWEYWIYCGVGFIQSFLRTSC